MTPLRIAISLCLVLYGCSNSPAREYDGPSNWEIVQVGDTEVPDGTYTLALDVPARERATLVTPCRAVEVLFVFDSDSEGVSFSEPGTPTRPCDDQDSLVDGQISHVLATAETWHMTHADAIEIRGERTMTIRRAAMHPPQ